VVTEPRATSTTTIGHLLRDLAPQVLAAVARRHDDFATAEDAVQDALIAAANQWPADGVPRNPRGWLYHVAVRRLTDHVRSELARRRREDEVAAEMSSIETVVPVLFGEPPEDEDDSLTLLFMCCHPALTPPTAIALTLRAVGGLTTAEIANAFFVPEATMAQRISRAKATIKASKIPFRMPTDAERSQRLAAVLQVLYLIFNEGYASSVGMELARPDLSNEAIRLTRATLRLLPDDAEVAGLLALMLLTDARRLARTGSGGELIPLDEQDRTLWNKGMIAEGVSVLSSAFSRGAAGVYQLQAAIAAVHDQAIHVEDTDWSQILALYGLLEQMSDSPMASLSRAVAAAMVHGPQHGLDMIDALERDARIAGHYRLDAVRGHLYEKAGNRELAVKHFRAASERTASIPERDYLRTKVARLTR
jgi:RNA polymerase sigma factor (sigma-70 family)